MDYDDDDEEMTQGPERTSTPPAEEANARTTEQEGTRRENDEEMIETEESTGMDIGMIAWLELEYNDDLDEEESIKLRVPKQLIRAAKSVEWKQLGETQTMEVIARQDAKGIC